VRFHDPQHFPGGASRILGLAHKNALETATLVAASFFPGCRTRNHLLLSYKLRGDFCGRLHENHFIFKQFTKTRSGSYRLHCLLLHLLLSRREACGGALSFSCARTSLELIFCSASLCSSSPDQIWGGWSLGPRAFAMLRTTTHDVELRTTSGGLPRSWPLAQLKALWGVPGPAEGQWSHGEVVVDKDHHSCSKVWKPFLSYSSSRQQERGGGKTDLCILPKPIHLLGFILPGLSHQTQEQKSLPEQQRAAALHTRSWVLVWHSSQ